MSDKQMKNGSGADTERLYREFKDYVDEISSLRKLLKTLHFSVSPDYVLQSAINIGMQIVAYQACLIVLWDEESDQFSIAARRHSTPAVEEEVKGQVREGFFDWALKEHKPISIPFAGGAQDSLCVIVPLARGNTRVGVMEMVVENECTQRQLELLAILADETAETIANLNLYREVTRTKNYLDNVFASMVDGVMTIDADGVIQMLSARAERLLKVTAGKAVGRRFDAVFPDQAAQIITRLQERTRRNSRSVTFDFEYTVKKHSLPVRFTTSVLFDEMKDEMGIIFVISDLSESRQLDELRRLDELKTSFLNNVSHELKTPLTSMKWAVDLIGDRMDELGTDDNMKKLLQIINDDNERLISLVTDLLDYSRIEAGKLRLELSPVNIGELTEDCIERMQMIAQNAGVAIDLALPGVIPVLMLDPEKMRQVINNLLSNAVKFSEEGGVVKVVMAIEQGYFGGDKPSDGVSLTVSDTGIGIPEEERENIFNKFYRVKNQKVKNVQGTGLGLSISKSIVELHGGTIAVGGKEGEGAVFTVTLPVT